VSKIQEPIPELIKVITSLTSTQVSYEFLNDLLTPEEFKEFANRWQVAKLLDQGISYNQISLSTGMSSTTIARVSKCLKRPNSGYQRILGNYTNNINSSQPKLN
jgi:TrpR-related protein YerC/YecD